MFRGKADRRSRWQPACRFATGRCPRRHFEGQGFGILRFWNDEVEKNIDAVCLAVRQAAKGRG
ncbi:DUF559 domain-containing protein [Mesorhizobium sp. NPDC059024]|uniref:DUF559 domain-containing protein n=1 Tax=Mesorhizobium sp. NPDC059024 TaxID=3346707 RepID=UPI0036830615